MTEQDHYAVLGVSRAATMAEIKRRYRALMRSAHPDANSADPQANRKAARINAAFEVLGDASRRREYDTHTRGAARRTPGRRTDRHYAHVAEQPDWEDIVAESVPPRRPAHVHDEPPRIEPDEIEVDMAELATAPRVKRKITVINPCHCTLRGAISTSEPWLWGPIGKCEVKPHSSISFDVEVIARKVQFPGLSRVVFVSSEWTGAVPVKITGFQAKKRAVPAATASAAPTEMSYVPLRRRRWSRR